MSVEKSDKIWLTLTLSAAGSLVQLQYMKYVSESLVKESVGPIETGI